MQGIICQEINYTEEAFMLLVHMADGESFEQLQKDFTKKYGMETEDWKRMFGLLREIEGVARKTFQKRAEDLKYYFGSRAEGFILFKAVLLWDGTGRRVYHSPNELQEELNRLPKGEYCRRFSEMLQKYNQQLWDDSNVQEERKPMEIVRRILSMKITDEEKLLLQDVFLEKEKHRNAVFELMEIAIEILKRFETELQREVKIFYEGWKKRLEIEGGAAYIIKHFQIKIGENPLGFEVRPVIIRLNSIILYCDSPAEGEKGSADIYRIGILFSDEFDRMEELAQEGPGMESQIHQALKVLSDKSKFEILAYIKDKKAYGSELAKHLNLSTATISHHMGALVCCGLVEMERVNNRVFYSGNRQALEEVFAYCRKVLIGEEECKETR